MIRIRRNVGWLQGCFGRQVRRVMSMRADDETVMSTMCQDDDDDQAGDEGDDDDKG